MKEKFNISGMTCAACVAHVQKAVESLEGTDNVNVNLLTNSMTLDLNTSRTVVADVIDAVERAGYGASVAGNEPTKSRKSNTIRENFDKETKALKYRLITSITFAIPLMYIAMGAMWGLPATKDMHSNPIAFALTQFLLLLPIMYVNRNYYIKGYKSLINRAPTMDSLIAIGSSAAVVYGVFAIYMIGYGLVDNRADIVDRYAMNLYFESAAMILTLITVGKYLETRSRSKTGEALERLMDMSPDTAIVERQGVQTEIPVEEVQVGDTVIVKPGGSIPVDGEIIEGNTSIDESAITGESIPVEKSVGSKVIQATINRNGFIRIQATKVGEDTMFAEIIRLVQEAGSSRAPIAKLADKVSGIFVPIVIGISVLTAIVWLLAGATVEFALSSAIAVLVISCPCALGLATPVAIMVGTGKAAENGILVKSGEALETAHELDCVVFDKTGTLTQGRLQATDIVTYGITQKELLSVAGSLEVRSEHPLAEAVTERASSEGATRLTVSKFEAVFGKGICGEIEGKSYFVGNRLLMKDNGIITDNCITDVERLEAEGKTVLIVACSDGVVGIIAVADILKPTSTQAVAELREMNVHTVMLTGDNNITANAIATTVGIDEAVAELLPQDKEKAITSLAATHKKTAMVGDGINDAPALTAADVGIALSNGTDIAIESADIVLMRNDLLGVAAAIRLSRAVVRNIRQNLFWAFFYNVIGIPLAAGVLYPMFGLRLTPMFGALAMSLSSLFVVSNALRLKVFEPYKHNKNKEETEKMKKTFVIEGMMCQNCVKHVQNALDKIGVKATVSLDSHTATIEDAGNITDEAIRKAIVDAGYAVK